MATIKESSKKSQPNNESEKGFDQFEQANENSKSGAGESMF